MDWKLCPSEALQESLVKDHVGSPHLSHLAWNQPRLSSFSYDMTTGGAVTGNVPCAFAITRPSTLHPSYPCLKHSQTLEVPKFPSTPTSMVEINPTLNPMTKIHPHLTHVLKGFQC
jgi:hypothetical protein